MPVRHYSPTEILALSLPDNPTSANTVRDYLKALLFTLWLQREMFSSKRPFGSSDWANVLYIALISVNAVVGALDEDGYVAHVDRARADELIESAIMAL